MCCPCRALIALAVLAAAPALRAADGRALALMWPGRADTGHTLDSIGTGNFTVSAWFMAQYPYSHGGPVVDLGAIAAGVCGGDTRGAAPPALYVRSGGRRHVMPLGIVDDVVRRGDDTIVLADFEGAAWSGWRVEGDAFDGPAGFLAQTTPCGWRGSGLGNTFAPDDGVTGQATLGPFVIERRFISLLVGGGNHPGRCCVNLYVQGAGDDPVATATGRGSEWLVPVCWDVSRYAGRRGAIRIVDQVRGGWGHLLVDEIVQTNDASGRAVHPGDLRRTWQHLAFVRRDGVVKLHLNGAPVGEPVDATAALRGTLGFGRAETRGRAEQFYGLIDDVMLFERALDPVAIELLAQSPVLDRALLADARPTGLWTFDDRRVLDLTEGAEVVAVSADRDDHADRERLGVPPTAPALTLPITAGTTWWVTQGYDHRGGTHTGVASFCLDMVRVDGPTDGAPVRAAAAGVIEHVFDQTPDGGTGPANVVVVRHASGLCTSYVHLRRGSAREPGPVDEGDVIGRVGDTGAGPGAHHLHVAATDLPEDGRHPFVTVPVAFSDYWVSDDNGHTWRHVERGVPETGQWVKCQRPR